MTLRKCVKCGDQLTLNEKLNLMECVSGRHLEPVNTVRAQWWNQCPKCGQMGTNDADGEAKLQATEKVEVEVVGEDGKTITRILRQPVTREANGKAAELVFIEQVAVPIVCRGCGNQFTKV